MKGHPQGMSLRSSLQDLRQEAPSEDERPLSEGTTHGKGHGEKEEGRYGLGRWAPDCLQVFNSPRWLLFLMCILCAMETGILLGVTPGGISTIEKRFELPSTKSGFLVSSTELFAVITVPIISYFGEESHKGRWLGAGAVCLGLGSILFGSPHFMAGRYVAAGTNISESSSNLCTYWSNGTTDEECYTNEGYSHMQNYLYVFIAAQFVMSFLVGPLYTLGITYLDDNVKKKVSGAYVGILYASATVGPAVGYVMTSQLLNQYIDWPAVNGDNSGLTPNDPRWLGNWWLGYFVLAVVPLLVAIPMFCFPRKLRGPRKHPEISEEETTVPSTNDVKKDALKEEEPSPAFLCGAQDFWSTVKDLGSNYSFVCFCLAGCVESIVLAGAIAFGPKLGETQLGLTPSESVLYLGLMGLPAGAIGSLFGGWITKKAGGDCKKLLKIVLVITGLSLLGHCVFLVYCTTPGTATYLYSNSDSASCSKDCGCPDSLYDPICDNSGIEYQSGCHAGCTGLNQTGTTLTYFNCSCIMLDWLNVTSGSGSEAVHGPCPGGCPGYIMPLFLALFVFLGGMTSATMPPYTATILRLVPESRRSFALGVQWTLFRLLGGLPGPVIFGYIIDQACVLWQDSCGEVGACVVYDSSKLGLYLFVSSVGIRLLAMPLYISTYCLCKPVTEEKTKSPSDTDELETMI
ncbi:solute carrier organic anion transporter family member 4A1-like isoform X1 [Branchiostoma lanceolatum]|uniref:solute carrier organic anion transporter family member 4A1-like isoform X1 n=2 Tax=Branchiostoma lanceolatum TaxID=7740 RepID=UPI00345709DE